MSDAVIFQEEFGTDNESIVRVEGRWGSVFPADYKAFLLLHNGGVPFPNFPGALAEEGSELWPIERFLSLGDIELQKSYPIRYSLQDADEAELQAHNLKLDELLVFAIAERGVYCLNLARDSGNEIYFVNFSDGDGIVRVHAPSFADLFDSLTFSQWVDDDDPYRLQTGIRYPDKKILQSYFFDTPGNPESGLNRFKEVFDLCGDIQPPEDGYPTIAQRYVHDRLKLEFLIEKGCNTDGLLNYAQNADTVCYLVKEKKLDINTSYKGRYPLQNYLSAMSTYDVKLRYELIAELLDQGIDMDWSINGTQIDGTPDLPMIQKLEQLQIRYREFEDSERENCKKSGNPEQHKPFPGSRLIEQKLGFHSE